MGPKKDVKKEVPKRENGTVKAKKTAIEDAINSNSWRCVVVMAVERTNFDSFVLKEFLEESSNGRRQEVSLIDYDTFVMKILNDFANGELPYKYAFLLNFSSVFQEAADYISKKVDIPILVLVKVIKALLFYLREEDLMRIEKAAAGVPDPIKVMADRPTNFGSVDAKKKDVAKKGDNGLKVRPPSVTKQDTELLKRGERAKDDQRIDDAPLNSYFNLYVLLTGFYNPDFPAELIRANIPLHAILCIDTSLSGVKREPSSTRTKFQKRNSESRSEEIQNFWQVFLRKLWDPNVCFHFKDTIFQVYVPKKLLCEKKNLREFIYREISYLMYELSDFKRQLNNYIEHLYLWNVEKNPSEALNRALAWPDNLSNECISVPVILQCIIDTICGGDWNYQKSFSFDSIDSDETERESSGKFFSPSKQATYGSCAVLPGWSQELKERGDFNSMNIYFKTKELDVKYNLVNDNSSNSEKAFAELNHSQVTCNFQPQECGENMKEMLLLSDGVFRSYWKKYDVNKNNFLTVDYCLFALLLTKLVCSFQVKVEAPENTSCHFLKTNSNFELIEELDREMRKPHFTVTEGSRSILRSDPFNQKNTSRDFFCPEQFKVVSPEKVQASSAPEFRVNPGHKIETLYTSEIFATEMSKCNPFENLKGFVDESLFSQTNDFDFLEFLGKAKLLQKEYEHWSSYNCIDHAYCVLNDCILLMLHNRKNAENIYHETFNETLKTAVGLRDFYDYVLEDEAQWLTSQEDSYRTRILLANKVLISDSYRDFTDSHFWLIDSIKYNKFTREEEIENTENKGIRTAWSSIEKLERGKIDISGKIEPSGFEGYNVSNMAVQFSGLKTIYYSKDCSVTVQLIERLYGNQDLGIHVTAASHTLHLYSYVCPEPRLLDPFTFHVTFKNGIVVAFGRRLIETYEEVEEKIESKTTIKGKKNSSELPARVIKKQISKLIKDEEFVYDMVASLPNGLWIRTVRRIVNPCYIKQCYLADGEENASFENSRLFLPNGSVIKMMNNGIVEILKVDASIVTGNLSDVCNKTDGGNVSFARYEVITGEGHAYVFEQGKITSSKRFQVFQNMDMDTNQIFFRRRDGTNYMLQNNGTLCVQFKDGTKMSSSLLFKNDVISVSSKNEFGSSDEEQTISGETDSDEGFVFVYTEIIAEHPDYATVLYDSLTEEWKILLPHDSTITIESTGHYSVGIDKQTEVKVEADLIQMNNFSCEQEPQCTFTADLSVFEKKENAAYCQMKDTSGKIFIVEKNSNCYLIKEDVPSSQEMNNFKRGFPFEVSAQKYTLPQFMAPADLQTCPSIVRDNCNKLLPENKYFVLRRDATGLEVLHKDDVEKALTRTRKGSLVFTQNIPGTEKRCFVLVTPAARKENKKWGVASILPSPKYEPDISKKTSSSTYGNPPSWMHPFPKRKFTFVVPQPLTCRVFLETKKTELCPETGTIDCCFCEMNDLNETRHSQIPPDGVEEYLKRLSEDDQDLLKEIYCLAAASLINEKKKLKPTNSKKLEHYLEMSGYLVMMREYHKKCIRYHIVPNYFHHPEGMSWLILNQLLLKLQLPSEKSQKQILTRATDAESSSPSPGSTSAYSQEEIEYNLSLSAGQSFSSLSCRSDLSAQTAPAILRTGGFCKCKVKPARGTESSPIVWGNDIFLESNFEESHPGICEFQENDIEMLEQKGCRTREIKLMSLEDLMFLGLI